MYNEVGRSITYYVLDEDPWVMPYYVLVEDPWVMPYYVLDEDPWVMPYYVLDEDPWVMPLIFILFLIQPHTPYHHPLLSHFTHCCIYI